jgi:WD40 repeat protein
LIVGQAALWNPPLVTVNSYNWIDPDNGVVGIATDDGRYSIYSKEGLSNPVNVASALKDGMIGACFSPDGNRYAALLTNQQVLLNDSERNLQLQIPISQINNLGGERSNFPPGNVGGGGNRGGGGFGNGIFGGYTNPCSQLFSWSPDSQKILIVGRSLKLYSFDDAGIQAIQPANPILNITADRVIWEPDGARLGIFEGATTAGNSNQAPKIFNYYNASNLELINSITIDTPAGAFLTANQALWSPNKHQIARVFFYNTEQSGLTMTLQIFNLPSQQGSLDKPVPAELAQNNSLNFGAGFYPNSALALSSTGTDLAVYQAHVQTTTVKPASNNAGIEGEISIFKVGANGKLTNTAKFGTGSYDIASLSWNPTDKELLGVDNAGNLKVWEESTQQPSSTPQSTTLNTPIIANPLFLKLTRLVENSHVASSISWSPDSSFLAQQNGSIISILDGKTGQFKFNLSSPISIEVQPNINPGNWSVDGQFFATDALMMNADEDIIGVWKVGAKEFTFVGAIRRQSNTTNKPTNFNFGRNGGGLTREETWSFALDKNAILVAVTSTSNGNNYILQYDLSKPLPPVEEQITFDPALEITNQPNSSNSNTESYTIVGAVGSSSAATNTTLVAWSPKQDQFLFRSLRYYSLFKLVKPAPTQTPFPAQTPITLTLVPQSVQAFAPPIKIIFSPDGKLIAFGLRNGTVKIFSSENGKPLTSLIVSNAELTDLEFSPDGQWLATSTTDRTVKIWQVSYSSSWKLLQVLRGFIKPVSNLTFAPPNANGQYLLTADTSGLRLMWRLS